MRLSRAQLIGILAIVLGTDPLGARASTRYSVTDIGSIQGSTGWSDANAINSRGQVTG